MKLISRFLPTIGLLVLVVIICAPVQAQESSPLTTPVQMLVPEVITVRPHDPSAYTQGFLMHDGVLYESAGRYGESMLRALDPITGEMLRGVDVPETYFAEGLALIDGKLIQLTWKAGEALIYDQETFEQIGTFEYDGEGWGLCADGEYLYMSDGSPFLDVRDPETFELIFSGLVTIEGRIIDKLNELECVGDYIYANIYQSDFIVKIDKTNGVIVAVIDASALLTPEEQAALQPGAEVLNGIAYLPDTDTFLLTGKHWLQMFEVRFVEKEQ